LKTKMMLTAGLSMLLMAGCGANDNGRNNVGLGNNDVTAPTRVNNPGYQNDTFNNTTYDYYGNRMDRPTRIGNTARMGNGTQVRNINNETPKMRVADRAADKIASMNEIDHANVIVTDNNAYVAARLRNNATFDRNLERKIADQVKSVDQDIDNVYVSVNPDFYDRMNGYTNDIRGGHPVNGFFDEFSQTVRRIFPDNATR